MKNPKTIKKADGFLSKKDYVNVVSIIESTIKNVTSDYKSNMQAYEDLEKNEGNLGAYEKSIQYDQGYYEGVINSLTAIKIQIEMLYKKDKLDRDRIYVKNRLSKIGHSINSLFKFLTFRK